MRSHFRAACVIAGIFATATVVACGEDVLAPPDGSACTAGSVSPGDSVTGKVTSTSCEVFDVDSWAITFAESWTLNAKKGTGYVIRVRHQSAPGLTDNIDYMLHLFGRNPQGDASFLTGSFDNFGANNGNGGTNEEMFFTATSDRTLSIRVLARTKADTGAYSLTVHSCPLVMLTTPADTATVDLSHGCTALSIDALPVKASFFAFEADSTAPDSMFITRTTGAASFISRAASPGYDINCWNDDCTDTNVGFGTSAILVTVPPFATHVVGWAAMHADSAATVSMAFSGPAPAGAPALMPASSARNVGRRSGRN